MYFIWVTRCLYSTMVISLHSYIQLYDKKTVTGRITLGVSTYSEARETLYTLVHMGSTTGELALSDELHTSLKP